MNLSCGNCKTIQPFSGDPPKCDACGWVCDSKTTTDTPYWQNLRTLRRQSVSQAIGTKDDDYTLKHLIGFVIMVAVFLSAFDWLTTWLTPEKQRLAEKYGVSENRVFIEPKPHGCDFDDAPLGKKHCHYEKIVDTEKACPGPDCRVTGVYVSWRKVDE